MKLLMMKMKQTTKQKLEYIKQIADNIIDLKAVEIFHNKKYESYKEQIRIKQKELLYLASKNEIQRTI